MNNIIVIGLHKSKEAIAPVVEVGVCKLCDEPVYLAEKGVTGELEIKDLKKLKDKKFLGAECALEITKVFSEALSHTMEKRQGVIDKLLHENQN
jgi:hypothetical protein